ncbi:S-adenosyl-L-methionine-dependent methyltransferase [Viridothelium virens]|uniref:S-adenosyl-L-methionine-dependent methyltransferase n=1 Tax=Viridothelium virens TaxID=1048519 RepID=A0A6A6HEK8_VIRVR|nr:S-adenosyl-L-methionine-dependent methyltransferase [Viridothelium virens]
MASSKPLEDLAQKVANSTKIVSEHLSSHNLPQPSFDVGAPLQWPKLPADVFEARNELRDASKKLHDLANGPRNVLTWLCWSWAHTASLQWINHFKIADAIPLDRVLSYAEIAKTASVDEGFLRRLLRLAITIDIFCEPRPSMVAHTAQSSLLRDPVYADMVGWNLEQGWRWSTYTVEAYEKWGADMITQGNRTPFNAAEKTDKGLFEFYSQPGKEKETVQFGNLMKAYGDTEGFGLELYVYGYDWGALGEATVVDVGAGHGQISCAIAREFPQLKLIVQDLPKVIAQAESMCPQDLKDRVTFQAHDFFEPQSVHGADVYMFKAVLHDWSDDLAIKLLQNVTAAMKPGSRILIVDGVAYDPGTFKQHEERALKTVEMIVMSCLASSEREVDQFKQLIHDSDSRLRIKNIVKPQGAFNSIIEIVFEG